MGVPNTKYLSALINYLLVMAVVEPALLLLFVIAY